jgi:hypothetical protein
MQLPWRSRPRSPAPRAGSVPGPQGSASRRFDISRRPGILGRGFVSEIRIDHG